MKTIIIQKKILILVTTFMLLFITVVKAQPDNNDGDPPEDTPIDGGISLLIAAGVGYGVKKVRDNRRAAKK